MAAIAPKPYCHFLNLNKIYKKMITKENNTAHNADFLISSDMVSLEGLDAQFRYEYLDVWLTDNGCLDEGAEGFDLQVQYLNDNKWQISCDLTINNLNALKAVHNLALVNSSVRRAINYNDNDRVKLICKLYQNKPYRS